MAAVSGSLMCVPSGIEMIATCEAFVVCPGVEMTSPFCHPVESARVAEASFEVTVTAVVAIVFPAGYGVGQSYSY